MSDSACFQLPTEVWTTKILPICLLDDFKRFFSVSKLFQNIASQSCPEEIALNEEDIYPEQFAFLAKNIHLCRRFSYGGSLMSFPSIENVKSVVQFLNSIVHKMKDLQEFRLALADNLQTNLIFSLIQKLPRKLKYLTLPGYFPFQTLPADLRIETETLELVSRPRMEVTPDLLNRITATKRMDLRDRQNKLTALLWGGKLSPTIEDISLDIRDNPRISEQPLQYSNIKKAEFCDGTSIKCLQNSFKAIERLEFWRTEIEIANVELPSLTSLSLIESTNVDIAEIFKCAPNLCDLSIQFSENVSNIEELSPKLTSLKLIHCELAELPPAMFTLVNLQKLSVTIPLSQDVPTQFTAFSSLKELDLSYDYEGPWSSAVKSLTQLEHLSVRNTRLKTFKWSSKNALTSLTIHGKHRISEMEALENCKSLQNLQIDEFPGSLTPLAHLTALKYLHITPTNLNVPCFLPFSRPITDPEWLDFIRDYISTNHVDIRRLRCLIYPNLELRVCQPEAKTENQDKINADDVTEKIFSYFLPKEVYLELLMLWEYGKRFSKAYALVLPDNTSFSTPLPTSVEVFDYQEKRFKTLSIGSQEEGFKIIEKE
jgi:hypothetical protein